MGTSVVAQVVVIAPSILREKDTYPKVCVRINSQKSFEISF